MCRCAGKSTTIFHMLNTRVAADASVLLTAVRNAAVAALLDKVVHSPQLRQSVVVVGNPAKLGLHGTSNKGSSAGGTGGHCDAAGDGPNLADLTLEAIVQQPRWRGDLLWLNAACLERCGLQACLDLARAARHQVCCGRPTCPLTMTCLHSM